MGWACKACTFEHGDDNATKCEICETPRASTSKPAAAKKKPTTQLTLFGTAAVLPETKKKASKESKKRKAPPPASSTNAIAEEKHPQATPVQRPAPFPALWKQAMLNMKNIFGISSLRNLQPITIESALKGKSQITVMATGGGKSLCYQLPATVLPGVTLVVSPLIALMKDQVQALNQKKVSAAHISSANTDRQNAETMNRLQQQQQQNPLRLLYCTPELIQTDRFQTILLSLYKQRRLSLIAIDEAHCMSTWGHDFRPAYRKLAWLRRKLPRVPCMACTATATPKVLEDIREGLLLKDCHVGSFDRTNLFYKVRFKDSLLDPKNDMLEFIQRQHERNEPCSGIVYVHTRNDTSMLAHYINKNTSSNITAAAYHAGLKDAERTQVQEDWTSSKVQIAIATVAFGMGIDLPHVRYVIHWSISKSLEAFYQESGRAGRDGLPSFSLVYYSQEDARKFAYLIRQRNSKNDKTTAAALESLEKMVNYCVTPTCRRQYVLRHFGEDAPPETVCKKTCDYCHDPKKIEQAIQSMGAVKDVQAQSRRISSQKQKSWDGQWDKPHGDYDHEDLDDTHLARRYKAADGLRITSAADDSAFSHGKRPKLGGFVTASSVLRKYEKLETSYDDNADDDDDFASKKRPSAPVEIPEHLRENMPDPLQHFTSKSTKTSTELAAGADQLKLELERLNAERQARMKALQSTKRGSLPPPPPPPLVFGPKKKSKRDRR